MFIHTHAAGGPEGSLCEATLFAQAQAGCAECLNQLMTRHDGLVQAVVRQQVLGDLPFSEALQAGRIGLWRAILGFDPSRGMAFSTYAWPGIKHQVWRTVRTHSRLLCAEREALRWPEAPDLEARRFSVTISGSGDVEMEKLDADTLDVTISGSGSLDVADGQVTGQNVTISGSGTHTARDLESARAKVIIVGSGAATIRASDHLRAIITGSGDVRYLGNPAVDSSVTGSGDVKRIGE